MRRRKRALGLTVIELMIGVAIVAVLVAVALPAYSDYRERQRIMQAISDLVVLNAVIKNYHVDVGSYPDSLADVGAATRLDPWGKPYVYLNLQDPASKGNARKNKNLVPINSDFDLYSVGKDGQTSPPLTSKYSRDDVVRANDGRYNGLAADYE